MTAWEEDQGTKGSMLTLLGDPRSEFTKALNLVLDDPGPMSVLGNPRCKRFSLLVKDCVVQAVNIAASDDDPAGDARPEVSMVEQMLKDLATLQPHGAATAASAVPTVPAGDPYQISSAWSFPRSISVVGFSD